MSRKIRPIVIAASPGGHLTQLLLITHLIKPKVLVTYNDRREFSKTDEFLTRITFFETRFNLIKHALNFLISLAIIIKHRPVALISTGGPFVLSLFLAARIFRLNTMYVDTLSRVTHVSGTCSLIVRLKLSDQVLVQWPRLTATTEGTSHHGSLFDLSNSGNAASAVRSTVKVL